MLQVCKTWNIDRYLDFCEFGNGGAGGGHVGIGYSHGVFKCPSDWRRLSQTSIGTSIYILRKLNPR